MIEAIGKLIQRYHKKGILVDTKLLLLYFVGQYDPTLISRFKRTDEFTVDDFELLSLIIQQFNRLVTTANILTELSNFSGQLKEPERTNYFRHLSERILLLKEPQIQSKTIVRSEEFIKFGLTDAGVFLLAKKSYLVLTPDFPLAQYLQTAGVDVINFNNIRGLI